MGRSSVDDSNRYKAVSSPQRPQVYSGCLWPEAEGGGWGDRASKSMAKARKKGNKR